MVSVKGAKFHLVQVNLKQVMKRRMDLKVFAFDGDTEICIRSDYEKRNKQHGVNRLARAHEIRSRAPVMKR